jgi:hypothetical protein
MRSRSVTARCEVAATCRPHEPFSCSAREDLRLPGSVSRGYRDRKRVGQPTRTSVSSGSETANSYIPQGLSSGPFFPASSLDRPAFNRIRLVQVSTPAVRQHSVGVGFAILGLLTFGARETKSIVKAFGGVEVICMAGMLSSDRSPPYSAPKLRVDESVVLLCRHVSKHPRLPSGDNHLDGVFDPLSCVS